MQRFVRSAMTGLPLVAVALLVCVDAAVGCPTCKDQLANDPGAMNIARGYFYSILFMLSMPALILVGLSSYFYYEVRRARRRQRTAPAPVLPGSAAGAVRA